MKKYIGKIKWYIVIQVFFEALCTLTAAAVPYIQKLLFDNALGKEMKMVFLLTLLYFACIISGLIFAFLTDSYSWKGAIGFEMALKRDFFKAISHYSYKRFAKRDIGEYISLQGNDITALEQDYLTPLIAILKSINMLIIYGIFLFVFVDWRIALIIFLASLASVFVPKITAKTLSKRRNSYLAQMGCYVSRIKDFWEGFKLINNRTRDSIQGEHEKILKDTANKRYHYGKFKVITLIINAFVIKFVGVAAFFAVGILLYKGEITIGTGVATFGYIQCFIEPIETILDCINTMNSLKEIKSKVLGYIEDNTPSETIPKDRFDSNITFDKVSINYDAFSLKDFSYRFEKDKKYALIGHSGSGKSTIVNTLMKYIEADSGNVYIDGTSLYTLDTSNVICCINQNEHMFADDFMNNVTLFDSYSKAKASKIVDSLKLKMMITIQDKDNCQLLSGGEKQILGIIRMLTADTPICIMDEPFSATDVNTTKVLENTLMNMKNKTIIMVTHKLSKEQLEQFDEIILMDSGKVVQSGNYGYISKTKEFEKLQAK